MLCLFTAAAVLSVVTAVVYIIILFFSDGDFVLMFNSKFCKQPGSLAGKVVWITGASSGIGESMAYCLAEAGCKLVLSARRQEELQRVKQACLTSSKSKVSEEDILVMSLDSRAFESHKAAVQKVLAYFNKVDVLVNNAGRSQRAKWLEVDLNVDRDLFEINVLGTVSLTQELLPHMVQRKQGHIVVMSSIAGKYGLPQSRTYTGVKHALHGYFECLRMEMAEHNIDVTLLCPGPVFSQLLIEAATGKPGENVGRKMEKDEKRMATDRCAYLSCVAIANRLYEAWISQQPILFILYVYQYFPDFGRWFGNKFGMKQAMKLREGK